jgi:hypothetical protein
MAEFNNAQVGLVWWRIDTTKETCSMPKNHTTHERGSNDLVNLTLRFDEELRQQLEDAANRSIRSMNSEIIFRLRTSFQRDEAVV